MSRSISLSILLALSFLGTAQHHSALAEEPIYPERPVTIISDAAPGSGADVGTRVFADALSGLWGKQVVVVNHPGANGSIAARATSDSANDGYTLLMAALSTFVAPHSVAQNLPLKVPEEFAPVAFAIDQPMFVAANASLPLTTLPQLIELAKKEPNKLSIALTGVGRLSHLTGQLIQSRADIHLLPIPYSRGLGNALGDVTSGRVSILIENYAGIAGAAKAGNVKLIAVGSAERLPDFPNLATISETLPGITASGWLALVAPVGTPSAIVQKINADVNKVASEPAVKKKLSTFGCYTRPMSPEALETFVHDEQTKWTPIAERVLAEKPPH